MNAPPVPECPENSAIVTTPHAVHLLVQVGGDWEAGRTATVAALERLTAAATAYARSPAFRERFGPRIGVVRAQTTGEAPSVVSHLMSERGIELEDLSAPPPPDGPTCGSCGRRLRPEQASLTDEGTACPACFRAWSVKGQPQLAEERRPLRIPPRLIVPLLVLFSLLFVAGAYYELRRLNGMNRIIRQHMPTE